jgi:hypothetical protein
MPLATRYAPWRLLNATLFSLAFWLPWTAHPSTNGLHMLAFIGLIIFFNPLGVGVLFGCVYTCLNIVLAFREAKFIQRRDLRIALWGWAGGSIGLLFWIEAQLLVGVWLMLLTLLSSYMLEYGFMPDVDRR